MAALGWIATFLAVWLGLSFAATGVVLADRMAGLSLIALVLVVLLAAYWRRGDRDLLRMLRRGLIVILPIVLAMFLPMLWVMSDAAMDVRLRQAILAGLIIVAGWLTTFVLQEERRFSERKAQEFDLLLALRSEVFTIVEKLDSHPITEQAEAVQDKIKRGGDAPGSAYFPFAASESPATVYDAVSGQLHVINPATLEPLLRFYAAVSELTAMVADTHRDEFRALEALRRVSWHAELTQQRKGTLYWGLRALEAVNRNMGVEKPEAIPRSGLNKDVSL